MSTPSFRNNLARFVNELVAIPSVTGDLKAANEVIDAASRMVGTSGALQSRGEINGYPHLLVTTKKPDEKTIWFVSHLDVVPAEEAMFKVTGDDKNYYGRGVFDMKGMAAATLAAFMDLPERKNKNVGLLFTTDEETGGKSGVGPLVNHQFKAGAAFVLDQSADWVLMEKMKGVLWLEITAAGKAAHGARPWLGHSANHTMIEYLANLKAWYDETMPKSHPENYYTTFNIGTLHGGQATNQVNDRSVATIDVRFVDEKDATKVIAAAQSLASKFKDVSIKELLHEPCVNTDTEEYWHKRTTQLIKKLGIKPGAGGERFGHGSTDGRYFAPFNIPIISVRPPGGGQHGPNEWVSKKGLEELTSLCIELMASTNGR